MLCFVPPLNLPTVITIGSFVVFGIALWPQTPCTRMSTVSLLAVAGLLVTPKVPTTSPTLQCSTRHTSGFGKRLYKPSSIIASAPMPRSSADCPMKTSVLFHFSFDAASACAVPTQQVMSIL